MVGHQAASTLLNKTGTAKTAQGRKLIVKGPGNAGRGSAQAGHINAGRGARERESSGSREFDRRVEFHELAAYSQ